MATQQSAPNNAPMWGDPNITEQLLIQETSIQPQSVNGGNVSRNLQRAGLLRKLRFYQNAQITLTGYTTAPGKSPYGPLSFINSISVLANGQVPLVQLSGKSIMFYMEVENPDGSVLTRPLNIAELNVTDSLKLARYDAIGATGTFNAMYPFEILHAIPVNIRGLMMEYGMWLLQNQGIDLTVTINFNPCYATSATNDAVWSAGTGIVTTGTDLNNSNVQIERELYTIPTDPRAFPNMAWAHQIVEFVTPFTGKTMIFQIPRSGYLLRALILNQDASAQPLFVEYNDILNFKWQYGATDTPVNRPGWAFIEEFLSDYDRQPPKGCIVLDFYRRGDFAMKLIKDTENLANLRIEEDFGTTTSGTTTIILDRLIPVQLA